MPKEYSITSPFNGDDMLGALIDSVSERVAERICSKIEERLQQSRRSQSIVSSSHTLSSENDDDQLITKAEACHLLDRCDSTLSKWAQRGILVPVRRGGQLYYRKADVMKMVSGVYDMNDAVDAFEALKNNNGTLAKLLIKISD